MGSRAENVAAHVWRHAEAGTDLLAFACGAERWSYGRLRERCARLAGAVRAAGVTPGERVVLIAPSLPEFGVAYYGLLAAGAVVVAMNPMATAREIAYVLDDADVALVLAWVESAAAAEEAAAARGVDVWRIGAGAADLPAGAPLSAPHPSAAADTAVILYTSGTTGQPKGAELTHANLEACARAFTEVLEITAADQFATALPLFHVFGGSVIMGTAIMNGASLGLQPRFNPQQALALIASGEPTIFAGVPTMYNALLQAADARADLSGLRFCCSGGASLPDEVLRAFDARFGTVILEGYGLTEVTGGATFNGLHRERKPGCVGIAVPGMEVRVVGEDGEELEPGEIGEVALRGPQVMKGYHGRPEATAEAIRDGWFHSGDLGSVDADGDLRIVDRMKDMVISGGYNVYPREVEEALYEHPEVVEAAVIGIDHPHYGEEVAAIVALRPGSEVDGAALRAWVKARLSAYKAPRLFQFVDELPKGPTGKILKRAIDADELFPANESTAVRHP